ncbi:steroid receptor RNA activator 1 [Bemisia tabaci]|uniref:steroid receptor RNA activator 1 n=1 Tax=Bemisia tabaci TaxID=7038 RepID=UPI003B289F3E
MGDGHPTNPTPKGYTPGWNDPPLFSYDSQTAHSNAPRKTNILTKRVAFPLQPSVGSGNQNKAAIDPTQPPTFKSNLPPPPCGLSTLPLHPDSTKVGSTESSADEHFSKEETLTKVLSNLDSITSELSSNKSYLEHADDIQRKLDLLTKMWNEDKLPKDVYQRLLKLTEALLSKDSKNADHLQVGLMVDHASLCSSWISAIRLLIRLRSNEEL